MEAETYEFEGFTLSAEKRLVTDRSGARVKLGPKAFDTLLELLRRNNEIVSRDELLETVWSDTIVEENNLTQAISALRKAFEESPGEHRFIVTVPGVGYKFVAEVRRADEAESGHDKSSSAHPSPNAVPTLGGSILKRRNLVVIIVILGFSISAAYYIGYNRQTGGAPEALGSVAVLPFTPIPGQPVNEAMQLGMTESLITQLAKGGKIQVRPLSATRKFSNPDRDPLSAGRELGVDAVIEGNIQIADGRVRVTARLYRVGDGKQLWSENYNEELRSLFTLQDSIAERAAEALRIKLAPGARNHRTENLAAYELYLRGRVHAARLVKPEVEKAVRLYEQAILADAEFALPHVGIAEAQRALLLSNDARAAEVVPRAKVAALRAVELAPDLPEAHTAAGMIAFFYDWNWKEAENRLRRSVELDDANAEQEIFYAHLLSNLGRSDEALVWAEKAFKSAPTNLLVGALEGQFLNHQGSGKKAIEKLRAVVELNDNFWLGHHLLSSAFVDEGRYEEAVDEALKAKKLAPFQTQSDAFRAYALARGGSEAKARAVLLELLERQESTYVPATNIAMIYAALGEKAKAIEYLEKGYEERDVRMPFLKVEQKWDPLRDEPGFRALLRKLDLD